MSTLSGSAQLTDHLKEMVAVVMVVATGLRNKWVLSVRKEESTCNQSIGFGGGGRSHLSMRLGMNGIVTLLLLLPLTKLEMLAQITRIVSELVFGS